MNEFGKINTRLVYKGLNSRILENFLKLDKYIKLNNLFTRMIPNDTIEIYCTSCTYETYGGNHQLAKLSYYSFKDVVKKLQYDI